MEGPYLLSATICSYFGGGGRKGCVFNGASLAGRLHAKTASNILIHVTACSLTRCSMNNLNKLMFPISATWKNKFKSLIQHFSLATIAFPMVFAMGARPALANTIYAQTNLTSDISGLAANTSLNLVNPWGMSFSATSPIWVSDQGTGVSTVYNGAGSLALTVTVPSSLTPPNGPTGQVNNSSTTDFGGANFIFATLAGTIDSRVSGTTAVIQTTTSGAVYTGLALAKSGGSNYLYAANFTSGGGSINVFNPGFANVTGTTFAGKFVDPSPIAGFAPYNIQLVGGNLYVEYAEPGATGAITGPGLGYVDVFDTSGNFIQRLATGGVLNAPWGIALAPSSGFGDFSADLLVGNFGNGQIDAFSPTGTFLGTLDGSNGLPLVNSGLWAIDFGNGSSGTSSTALYFTAGINGEADGLFGDIQATPEPPSLLLLGAGLLGLVAIPIGRSKFTRLNGVA